MMYAEGQLLSFTPFVFKNGAPPKKKYYIVLKQVDDTLMLASLPTSKDHLPADIAYSSGCINIPERSVNAYVFLPGEKVTSRFGFVLPTFVYGEQVDEYEVKYLNEMKTEVEYLGMIHAGIFKELKDCLKRSSLLKRRYRKLL